MPLEPKPLFRPDVLRKHLDSFRLPAAVKDLRPELAKWAGLIESGRIDDLTEKEILPDFLTVFFGKVLGYTGPAESATRYTLSREKHVEVDGKYADAVLGAFTAGGMEPIVAVEGKGPRDSLDRPFAGRKMSAVDQGYRYAINLPCDWIIITSIRQTRLYHKGSTQQTFERFDTVELAEDERQLLKFVFLLGAERVVPATGRCHLYALLTATEKVGREVTKEFYVRYADIREDTFEALCRENPEVSRHEVLQRTQKVLDRILFCAFCKDRGLLPPGIIEKAYQHRDPFNPRPIWDNFRGLFRAVDKSDKALGIDGYNGGLFAEDALLDRLKVPDDVCAGFRDLAGYDYRPANEVAADPEAAETKMVDVEILGHIFEQSITDLEKLRNELDGLTTPLGTERHKTRRKKEGAFYTPKFITRYIIEQALGPVLKERFERLRQVHAGRKRGANKVALDDPNVFEPQELTDGQRETLIDFWSEWEQEITRVRLLDPACGSGAFLIEAFAQFRAAYQTAHDALADLRGHMELYDLDRQILEKNLFGVDLNEEAIEICKLSLWIRTAERGKTLTNLDPNIRVGNSLVSDAAVDLRAFEWKAAFPKVFAVGGFDVVVGNPPYVRQEWISQYKPYFEKHYQTFDSTADLYVYFYELGMNLLKPGGRLSLIVTNKWMKAGYGEPLRRFLAAKAWVESVVNFGHAKQIFEEADVFPSIIVARKPAETLVPPMTRVCDIPREQLRINDLSQQIQAEGFEVPRSRFGAGPWSLEPPGAAALMDKIRQVAVPLKEFAGTTLYRGVLTGFNEAFLLDGETKKRLVKADPNSADLFMPYLRGQDINRWQAEWTGLWMLAIKSSSNNSWPWSEGGNDAEAIFAKTYPAVHEHLVKYRVPLVKRQDQGEYWWELRACAYWERFGQVKIMYQDIAWEPCFCLDTARMLSNNTVYFIPAEDRWILAVLNSPVSWWFAWRSAQHGKDEALRLFTAMMETFPIPRPSHGLRDRAEQAVDRLVKLTGERHEGRRAVLDWLRVEFEIEKPSLKLQDTATLEADTLIAEVKKARGKQNPLTVAGLKALKTEHGRSIVPLRGLAATVAELEREIGELVNGAYGLTAEEVELMWKTAPPRMPLVGGN